MPPAFDLRAQGRVPGVRNQGTPGPCWAFAALGACESSYLTRGLTCLGDVPDLSEMHLAYFVYEDPAPGRAFTSRFKGRWALRQEGNVLKAAAFLSRLAGPARERDLPYSMEGVRDAASRRPEDYARCLRLRDVLCLSPDPEPLDKDLKKRLILEHGAIAVSYYSDRRQYHEYARGKDPSYYNNRGRDTNHDVILIGWDDRFPRENFRVPPTRDGAWLARDSWGIFLGGNRGYFWISYDQYLFGGAAFLVEEGDARLRHYGHDDLGWCGNAGYEWGANVFRCRDEGERLTEVAFYAPENGARYEIFVYDLGEGVPASPTRGAPIARMSGALELAGYHTLTLPEPVPLRKGSYFSVVLRVAAKNPRPLAVETRVPGYSEGFLIHPGESYFSWDGRTWTDGAATRPPMNACVKAFTLARRGLTPPSPARARTREGGSR